MTTTMCDGADAYESISAVKTKYPPPMSAINMPLKQYTIAAAWQRKQYKRQSSECDSMNEEGREKRNKQRHATMIQAHFPSRQLGWNESIIHGADRPQKKMVQ